MASNVCFGNAWGYNLLWNTGFIGNVPTDEDKFTRHPDADHVG